jgi:hypothetical protein
MSEDRKDVLRRRPWRELDAADRVGGVPTMLSRLERCLLYSLARDFATGEGAIVDAGCFLGGSTAALLGGLRDRPDSWSGPPVETYDLFRVEAYTVEKFFSDDPSVQVGDSFRSRFDEHVAGFGVPHVVHEGDITEIGWSGGPIEVLFLDVLKSWEINDAVMRDFFPSLIPGRSVIVQQDYGCGYMPWIPISVELMRDSLEQHDDMEWGSVVYSVVRELPGDVLERGLGKLDHDARMEILNRAIERSDGWLRGMNELSKTAVIVSRDGKEAGLRDLDRLDRLYGDYPYVTSRIAYAREGLLTNWTFGYAPKGRSWTARLADAGRRLTAAARP